MTRTSRPDPKIAGAWTLMVTGLRTAELGVFLPSLWLVAAFHAATASIVTAHGLSLVYPWADSLTYLAVYVFGMATSSLWVLLPGMIKDLTGAFRGVPAPRLSQHLERYRRLIVGGLPGALIFVFALLGNANLKPAIPALNSALYDGQLEAWERTLFGGVLPTEWLIKDMSRAAYDFWDYIYGLFGNFILVSLAIALHFKGTRGGARLITAVCLGYILCTAWALLYPTLGPVYVHPEWFSRFSDSRNAAAVQLLADHAELYQRNPHVRFVVSGIAAMPSFHVCSWSVCVLCWRVLPRPIFAFGCLLVLLNWGSTVALGWHYWLDGLAGVALALLSWKVACRWVPESNPAANPSTNQPANQPASDTDPLTVSPATDRQRWQPAKGNR
ncbi:MAG: phosphatase PAP2 family protein [Myxococcales bacterium]|nr:phosphatase PAP2 family protein [Myxococcales bacterium]